MVLRAAPGSRSLRPIRREHLEQVYCAATSAENIALLAHLADGAAYPAVRPEVLMATEIVRPESSVTAAFSAITSPILELIASNGRLSRTLTSVRDTLVPRLMSGQIGVPTIKGTTDGQ